MHWLNWIGSWNFIRLLGVAFLLILIFVPSVGNWMLGNLFAAIAPFMQPLVLLIVVVFGYYVLLRPLRKKGNDRRH